MRRQAKKWIQKAIKEEGSLRKHYGLGEGEKIDVAKAKADLKKLQKKSEGEATLSKDELTLLKRLSLFVNKLHPLSKERKKTKKSSGLRGGLVRLAYIHPEFRKDILSLLR